MKTFTVEIKIGAKITVPESVLKDIRAEASLDIGADVFLSGLQARFADDDDAFLQAALKNALRNIARNAIVNDIGGLLKVGVKAAPAEVTVSVPERVVTKVKDREQVAQERLSIAPVAFAEGYIAEDASLLRYDPQPTDPTL